MDQVTYTVLLHRGEWQIECNGHYYGPHRDKETALKLAVAAAELAKRDGDSAKVVLQERNDDWCTVWQHRKERGLVFAW